MELPVSWAALNVLQDTTNGLSQSGYVRWHPPADWKRCALRNTLRAFYVRFRVTTSGTAPVVAAYDTNTGTGGILRAHILPRLHFQMVTTPGHSPVGMMQTIRMVMVMWTIASTRTVSTQTVLHA